MAENRIDYLENDDMIRNRLGGASFVSGLICFYLGSTYDKLFGKFGFGGFIVYLGIGLIIVSLIWGFKKRIEVPKGIQVFVETILCVVICLISVGLDELVPGKSDVFSIISYGLFALMSVSTSRKSELGFETGFFAFFMSLFSEQLFKANWKLLPAVLGFCFAALFLRHRSQSGSPIGDEESQLAYHLEAGSQTYPYDESQYSGLPYSIGSSRRRHSPSNDGQVSEENISDGGNEQNNEQEKSAWDFLNHFDVDDDSMPLVNKDSK